ncbi:hypothetical protein [uncultured Ruminococcus sp.]|uniref:hypothetical protein n=1 Tax=uncultured Ruminococcus sp. TaxID=165186 RepID=UPI0025E983B5|nr:hypothetical protein [uncultured Ruminococcus sp.]
MENKIKSRSICSCCGSEINDQSKSYCDVCGMPKVTYIDLEEAARHEPERVEVYKRKYFDGDIRLKCFTYKYDADSSCYRPAGNEYVKLCDRVSYKPGAKVDLDLAFSEIASDRKITLNVRVNKENKNFDSKVDLIPGKTIGHSNIAIEFQKSMKACFVVRYNDDEFRSEEFDM